MRQGKWARSSLRLLRYNLLRVEKSAVILTTTTVCIHGFGEVEPEKKNSLSKLRFLEE